MQKIYSKDWKILLVQTDNLTGEVIGSAISELYQAGASNVQVISTITKKNRPGHLITIDVRPDYLDAVEKAVIGSLGVSGWQCVDSVHRHLATQQVNREVDVYVKGHSITTTVIGKQICNQPEIRPEVSCCVDLQERIYKECQIHIPMRVLLSELTLFFRNPEQTQIHFAL